MVWKDLTDGWSYRLPDDYRDPFLALRPPSGKKMQLKLCYPGINIQRFFTALAQLCALGSKFYPQGYPQLLNRVRRRISLRRSECAAEG